MMTWGIENDFAISNKLNCDYYKTALYIPVK